MGKVKEMWGEANDAFYAWEELVGKTDLSDRDRIIWCEGWIVARYEDKITASYAVPNGINNETNKGEN